MDKQLMVSWDPRTWFGSSDDDVWAEGHGPDDRRRYANHVRKQRIKDRKQKLIDEQKQEDGNINRRSTLSPELQREVEKRHGVRKPYDPEYLKSLSNNWVAQAYIDTMAQDLATAPWSISERDEQSDVDDDLLAEAERTLKQLHPTLSFRDLLEQIARGALRLGDGAWIKHYRDNGDLAEAVPVDTSRMYKVVDKHGFAEGYLQASNSRQSVAEFDLDDVVWSEWSYREDHVYGHGPVEKAAEVIEVIEELGQKEINDLAEGMPPGVVSVSHGDNPKLAKDAHDKVKQNWDLKKGERHRAPVTHGDWDFTPFDSGYQELQFIERNKLWIQSLGAIFKVNSPYAGFDFQEGNRAQNEAQTQAYKQRGFAVLLRQIQEAINRQLVWVDLSEDLKFEFEQNQTIKEKQQHAQYQKQLADAAEQWDNLGRPVTYRDGMIDIESGEVDAPEDTGGDGGLFGMSMDVSKLDPDNPHLYADPEDAVEAAAELGLDGIHRHEHEDGRVWWMPGSSHEEFAQVVDVEQSKAVSIETPMETSAVSDEGMADWRSFLRQVRRLDGMVENPETGVQWPNEGDEPIPPSQQLIVHGIDASVVGGLLEAHDGLGFEVQDHESRNKDALTKDQVRKLDECLLEAHKTQIQPKTLGDIEKRVWTEDDSVPEYVIEKISEVIDAGAIFDNIKSVPAETVQEIEDIFESKMTQSQGWSLDSLVDGLSDAFPGVSDDQLETVARTESASVLNQAREEGYEDLPSSDTNPKFYWTGPGDSRTTELCEALKAETNPNQGGDPLEMPALKRLHEDLSNQFFTDLEYREFVGHPNERHTFVRAPPQGVDVELSVEKELPDEVFEDISEDRFIPPEGAADEAQQALDWIDEHGRDEASGATREGLDRARQIIDHVDSNEPMIEENDDGTPFVTEIANFFARSEGNEEIAEEHEGEPWKDNGYLSHLLWGGDPAKSWAQALDDRLEEEGHI